MKTEDGFDVSEKSTLCTSLFPEIAVSNQLCELRKNELISSKKLVNTKLIAIIFLFQASKPLQFFVKTTV